MSVKRPDSKSPDSENTRRERAGDRRVRFVRVSRSRDATSSASTSDRLERDLDALEEPSKDAVPLVPGHEWDLSTGPHMGRGAALRVPVSEGPSSYRFDRGNTSQQQLIAEEPVVEPLKFMELGLDYEPRTRRKIHELDLPIRQDS